MKERQKQVPALRKIFIWLLCLFAMILLAGTAMLAFSDMDARRAQWERTVNAADEQISGLDSSLSAINLYIIDLLMSSEEIDALCREYDVSQCNRAGRSLSNKLTTQCKVLAPAGEQPGYDPERPGWGCFEEKFQLRYGALSLVIIDRPGENLGAQMSTLCFLLVILLIVAGFSVYTLNYFQRYIQRPFEQLRDHVNSYVIERQNAKRRGFAELNEAMSAFGSLLEQLNRLKIEQYEERITLSKTELEFFQLQIKPHFFVNSFSIIYGMAQKKDFARIQDFCLKLSEYVRYLFRDGLTTTTLEDELKAVKDGAQFARMSVTSNRSTFSAKTLDSLNAAEPENGGSQHLGIWNVRRRLSLMYGDEYELRFANDGDASMVEVILPDRGAFGITR